MESFFSTIKHELGLDNAFEFLFLSQQQQSWLAFWIDGYYNREHRHSTVGCLSWIDYELQYTLPVHSPPRCPDDSRF
jgi:putative transposase